MIHWPILFSKFACHVLKEGICLYSFQSTMKTTPLRLFAVDASVIQPSAPGILLNSPILRPRECWSIKKRDFCCWFVFVHNLVDGSEIRLTSWYGKYPMVHRVLYIPGCAGFLPSTICSKVSGSSNIDQKKTSWESKRDLPKCQPNASQMPRFSLEIAGPVRGLFSGTMKVITVYKTLWVAFRVSYSQGKMKGERNLKIT